MVNKKQPTLIALDHATIRIDPPVCPTCYVHIQIMRPPSHNDEGNVIEPGSFYGIYLPQKDAKLLADALYAQGALDLVE